MRKIGFFYDIDGCYHPFDKAKKDGNGKIVRGPNDGLFVWAHLIAPLLDEFPNVEPYCHSHWRNLYEFDELMEQLPPVLRDRTKGIADQGNDKFRSMQACANKAGLDVFVVLEDDPWACPVGTKHVVIVPSDKGLSAPGAIQRLREAFQAASLQD